MKRLKISALALTVFVFGANYSVTAQTEEHTTTTTTTSDDPNVNVNMNVNGVNMNVNSVQGSSSTTTTHTTTTTTSSSGYSAPPPPPPAPACPPMDNNSFNDAKSSINSKSFEESKMTMAKQIIGSNCILATQVKEIMMLFSFEQSRLDFAKFAYDHTLDRNNYFKVNDAFQFESSIDELNKYTSGRH